MPLAPTLPTSHAEQGVPRRAHIYSRTISSSSTRYRQAGSYYRHCCCESGNEREPIAAFRSSGGERNQPVYLGARLESSIRGRSATYRALFWNRTQQDRPAQMLALSQQEASRRKLRLLRLLVSSTSIFSWKIVVVKLREPAS